MIIPNHAVHAKQFVLLCSPSSKLNFLSLPSIQYKYKYQRLLIHRFYFLFYTFVFHLLGIAAKTGGKNRGEPQLLLKGEEEEEEEDHYEDDADAADLLMGGLEDPKKMRKQIEDRVKKKQKTIFQAKTGSAEPMSVTFNNFDFSDSYIWIEFERAPSDNDLRIISGTVRSWFVLGHLGGYNSSNMQLTELPIDKQPSYDIVRANKDIEDAITFENIGDIEIQDKLGRIWVDIGNSDPLTLDVLINALRSLSSDYIGIRQLVFGGKRWGNWKEGKTSSQDKCKVWRI